MGNNYIKKDFQEFLEMLNKHSVEYCIVGGYAVAFHAQPRYTKDLDVFISISEINAKKMVDALKDFGVEDPAVNENIFLDKGKILRIGIEPVRIEIINDIDGVESVEVFNRKVSGHYGNVDTFFIGLDDLIKNKEAMLKKKSRRETSDKNDLLALLKVKNKKEVSGKHYENDSQDF